MITRDRSLAVSVIPHRCAGAVNIAAADLSFREAFCSAKTCVIESSQYHPQGTAKVNAPAHQLPRIARANGIELCYEIFGAADAEPMLLIMGLGGQMIHWEDDFCLQDVGGGFRAISIEHC